MSNETDRPQPTPESDPFEYLWEKPGGQFVGCTLLGNREGSMGRYLFEGDGWDIALTRVRDVDNTRKAGVEVIHKGTDRVQESYILDEVGVSYFEVVLPPITKISLRDLELTAPQSEQDQLKREQAVSVAEFVAQQV